MDTLIKIGQLLLSLSILIVLHELGHFLFARLFKTRVEKFYLFFDPWFSLFKVKKGDTEYGIGWLPLGGYVKISGMIDESMDKEQLSKPPQPYEFRSKPSWQRLLIMLGGVIVNLILGFVIYTMILFAWGETYIPNKSLTDGIWVQDSVMTETIGLKTGDKVISINDEVPERFSEIILKAIHGGKMIVERDGKQLELTIPIDFAGTLTDNSIKSKGSPIAPRLPFVIATVPDTSHNAGAGLLKFDRLIGINGVPFKYFDEYGLLVDTLKGQTVNVTILRENEEKELALLVDEKGKIGVEIALKTSELERLGYINLSVHKYTFLQSIPAGFRKAKTQLYEYIKQVGLIFNFKSGAYKGIGGFAAIGNLFPPSWDWHSFWELTAFLSLMLAFLNILPIPALDGGHVAFLLYEMVTGRKPGEKFLEYAQIVGMVLLLFLLVYANLNDLLRFIKGM